MYSPIREDGHPAGVLVTAAEVTEKVRSRGDPTRRLEEEHRIACCSSWATSAARA